MVSIARVIERTIFISISYRRPPPPRPPPPPPAATATARAPTTRARLHRLDRRAWLDIELRLEAPRELSARAPLPDP
jgi:hypothetical protein